MKTIISALILLVVLMVSVASCSDSTASTKEDNDATVTQNVKISGPVAVESSITEATDSTAGGFISEHWGKLLLGLLGFYDLVARLTPTSKDNTIATFLGKLFNVIIPNLKRGGGNF